MLPNAIHGENIELQVLQNPNRIPGVGAVLKLMLITPAARICGRNRFNLTRLAVGTMVKQPQFCVPRKLAPRSNFLHISHEFVTAFDSAKEMRKRMQTKRNNSRHVRIVQHPAHRMPFVVIPRDKGSGKPSAARMQWALTPLRMSTVSSFNLIHIKSLPCLLLVTPLLDFADHRTHQKL